MGLKNMTLDQSKALLAKINEYKSKISIEESKRVFDSICSDISKSISDKGRKVVGEHMKNLVRSMQSNEYDESTKKEKSMTLKTYLAMEREKREELGEIITKINNVKIPEDLRSAEEEDLAVGRVIWYPMHHLGFGPRLWETVHSVNGSTYRSESNHDLLGIKHAFVSKSEDNLTDDSKNCGPVKKEESPVMVEVLDNDNTFASTDQHKGVTASVLIGHSAGADLKNERGVTIIGDNIRDLNESQENVLFIGDKLAIGDMVLGVRCNLKDIILGNNKNKMV